MPNIKNALVIVVFVGIFFLPSAMGQKVERAFTLSDKDLMSLDVYLGSDPNKDPNTPSIVAKRDISGPGVEFDIYFPPDNKHNNVLIYVSCSDRGKGALVGIDVNDFDAFALKFTLIAVDGKSDVNSGGLLIVRAVIDGNSKPEEVSFSKGDEAISTTKKQAQKTSMVGFCAQKLSPDGWNPQGNTVTIRIEAAPNAEML